MIWSPYSWHFIRGLAIFCVASAFVFFALVPLFLPLVNMYEMPGHSAKLTTDIAAFADREAATKAGTGPEGAKARNAPNAVWLVKDTEIVIVEARYSAVRIHVVDGEYLGSDLWLPMPAAEEVWRQNGGYLPNLNAAPP